MLICDNSSNIKQMSTTDTPTPLTRRAMDSLRPTVQQLMKYFAKHTEIPNAVGLPGEGEVFLPGICPENW